jgi:uncharacterized protein YggE
MPQSLRSIVVSVAVATLCALAVALAVVAFNRPPTILIGSSAATNSNLQAGILASGDGTVSKKPDLAIVYAGVNAKASTASAAQQQLASQAARLIAKVKGLGVLDKDINTSNYSIGPNYVPSSGTPDGYQASEQLIFKWHNVDSIGRTLDILVQDGGATNIGVSFGLNDVKAAQTQARAAAIADAKSKAQAMALAAGVTLGPVVRVSDLSFTGYPSPMMYAYKDLASGGAQSSQVPAGSLDVQVTVEVDFAIGA